MCTWYKSSNINSWGIGCNDFYLYLNNADVFIDFGYKYCPYCGEEIKVVSDQEEVNAHWKRYSDKPKGK